jgi:hypothetical protein
MKCAKAATQTEAVRRYMKRVPLVVGFIYEQPPPPQETLGVLLLAMGVDAKDLHKTPAHIGVTVLVAPCRPMHSHITFCLLWQCLSV